jgi:serine/threonine protein kinase
MRGTTHTVAPEVLGGKPYDPYKADAWSLGVLLYFMANAGRYPHDAANTIKHIINNDVRRITTEIPEELHDLIFELMLMDPKERMSVGEIFQHPWFGSGSPGASHQGTRKSNSIGDEDELWTPTNVFDTFDKPAFENEEDAAIAIQRAWRNYVEKRREESAGQNEPQSDVRASETSQQGCNLSNRGETRRKQIAALACSACGRMPPARLLPGQRPYSTEIKFNPRDETFY